MSASRVNRSYIVVVVAAGLSAGMGAIPLAFADAEPRDIAATNSIQNTIPESEEGLESSTDRYARELSMRRLQTVSLSRPFLNNIAIAEKARKAYVPRSSNIDVIDMSAGLVTSSIDYAAIGGRALVAESLGKVYVSGSDDGLGVIDIKTDRVTCVTEFVTRGPLAIDQRRSRLYATSFEAGEDRLVVFDAHTDTILQTIAVAQAFPEWPIYNTSISSLAVDEEAQKVYVAARGGTVSNPEVGLAVVDLETTNVKRIGSNSPGSIGRPNPVVFDERDRKIYSLRVIGMGEISELVVIDPDSEYAVRTIPLAPGRHFTGEYLAVDPAVNRVYVTGYVRQPKSASVIVALEPTTDARGVFEQSAAGPLAVDSATNRVYVGVEDINDPSVAVYSPAR